MLVLLYVFAIRPINKEERCSQRITGKVIRYSRFSYSGMRLPVVEYIVDGIPYKVAGPKFKMVVQKHIKTPPNKRPATEELTNFTSIDNIPDKLVLNTYRDGLVYRTQRPLYNLFPVGKEVDVYYNPRRPKEAFVIRYAGYPRWFIVLITVVTIGIIISVFVTNSLLYKFLF